MKPDGLLEVHHRVPFVVVRYNVNEMGIRLDGKFQAPVAAVRGRLLIETDGAEKLRSHFASLLMSPSSGSIRLITPVPSGGYSM